jgi:hypothetical protein
MHSYNVMCRAASMPSFELRPRNADLATRSKPLKPLESDHAEVWLDGLLALFEKADPSRTWLILRRERVSKGKQRYCA